MAANWVWQRAVSTRAPVPGATIVSAAAVAVWAFQSTRPCGARRRPGGGTCSSRSFQSTRPCGARHSGSLWQPQFFPFQSTRPCGARLRSQKIGTPRQRFNPRARVGRDFSMRRPEFPSRVSIHAPVWGATAPCISGKAYWPVFQSTRPCGARQGLLPNPGPALIVSIHAPVWGATAARRRGRAWIGGFNPRARVGRDLPAVRA